jgi:hypothetical protein
MRAISELITFSPRRRNITFFKSEAKKQRVPYQKMIGALVDGYAARVGMTPLT